MVAELIPDQRIVQRIGRVVAVLVDGLDIDLGNVAGVIADVERPALEPQRAGVAPPAAEDHYSAQVDPFEPQIARAFDHLAEALPTESVDVVRTAATSHLDPAQLVGGAPL